MLKALFRWFAWATVVILLLLAVMLVLLNTSVGHGLVRQGLQQYVHPQLEVRGPIDISVWPTLSVQANDLSLPATGSGDRGLTVGELRLSLSWWRLRHRVVHIEQALISDVTLKRSTARADGSEGSAGLDFLSGEAFKRLWQTRSGSSQADWQLIIDRLVVDRLAFWQGEQQRVAMERAELAVVMQLTPVPLGEVTVRAEGMSIESQASERIQAALEQVGLGDTQTLVIDGMQGRWQLSDGLARAVRWRANGPWGEVSADNGSVDLQTGQTMLPMRVQLNGQLKHQRQGIQIQTRQADIRFILKGPIDNLGINPPP